MIPSTLGLSNCHLSSWCHMDQSTERLGLKSHWAKALAEARLEIQLPWTSTAHGAMCGHLSGTTLPPLMCDQRISFVFSQLFSWDLRFSNLPLPFL